MIRTYTLLLVSILTLLFHSTTSASNLISTDSLPSLDTASVSNPKIDSILNVAKKQLGTPYGYGNNTTTRFDCSGLTRHCYSSVGIELPHSSAAQAKLGEKIKLKDAQKGDLIFFKGRSTRGKSIGHVAIVVSNENGEIHMIHATSRGVIIDHYNKSEYYTRRFVEVRRIIN
jgi:cell wall-associated NlpC family hydrolase